MPALLRRLATLTDEYHLGELGRLPNITHMIAGVATNTRGTKAYDKILLDRVTTAEYMGAWGVLDLANEYGLSLEKTLDVSDHLPVWAEFSALEAAGRSEVATLPEVRR